MSTIRCALSALSLAALTACATPAARHVAPVENSFDCDVPAGSYSEWARTLSSSTLKVEGTVQVAQLRKHEKWIPGANVFLRGRDGEALAGLQFSVAPSTPNDVQVVLFGPRDPRTREAFATKAWGDGPLAFSLELNASGLLTATVAGHSSSRQVTGFELHKFALGCSTGEFQFDKVFVTER